MEAKDRSRPILEPIWTEYHNLGGYPRTAFRVARTPGFSASPASPKTLPSPMHPDTPIYDSSVRNHEAAMVDSLERRGSTRSRSASKVLSPIVEQHAMAARLESFSMNSPTTPRIPRPPQSAPVSPRGQTLVSETRSLLLSGVPRTQASTLAAMVDRRQSAPAEVIAEHRRRSQLLLRHQLQAWGHVHFGNASKADIFVAAVAFRRSSEVSLGGEDEEAKPSSSRTVRARVRPKALDRKPFLIQRTFDLSEMRSIVPEPTSPSTMPRRPSLDIAARAAHQGSRRRSVSVNPQSPGRVLRSASKQEAARSAARGTKEIPIRKLLPAFLGNTARIEANH